jgi:hypothetical protein
MAMDLVALNFYAFVIWPHHSQNVPRTRTRLEHFDEIWQFITSEAGRRSRFPDRKCSKLRTNLRKIKPNTAISSKQFRLLECTLIGWLRTIDASDLGPMVASGPQ